MKCGFTFSEGISEEAAHSIVECFDMKEKHRINGQNFAIQCTIEHYKEKILEAIDGV